MATPDQRQHDASLSNGGVGHESTSQLNECTQSARFKHELLNLLNGICGFAELLLDEYVRDAELSEPCRDHLRFVSRQGRAITEEIRRRETNDLVGEHAVILAAARELEVRVLAAAQEEIADQGGIVRGMIGRIATMSHELYDLVRFGNASSAPQMMPRDSSAPVGPLRETIRRQLRVNNSPDPMLAARAKILIVDDSRENREILCHLLGQIGYVTVPASGGRAALDLLHQASFDLVLLDLMMPEIDGEQVLKAIRQVESFKNIPVLMNSANDQVEAVVRCIENGAEDYLLKSVNPTILYARVGASIERKLLRDREDEHVARIKAEQQRSDDLLNLINRGALEMFRIRRVVDLAGLLLEQVQLVLGNERAGAVFVATDSDAQRAGRDAWTAVVARGEFAGLEGATLGASAFASVQPAFEGAPASVGFGHHGGFLGCIVQARGALSLFVCAQTTSELTERELALLRVLAGHAAFGFENVALVEELDHLAFVDPSLGIPNFNGLRRRLERDQEGWQRLVVIEIKEFDSVSSAYGTQIAVELLKAVVERLSERMSIDLFLARIGENVLGILDNQNPSSLDWIRHSFAEAFWADNVAVALSARVGVVGLSNLNTNADEIMSAARATLEEARRHREGEVVHYQAGLTRKIRERVNLHSRLRAALRNRELEVYLQPKVDIRSGQIVGAEALSRWFPGGLAVAPNRFIPLAETCELTRELLESCIEKIGTWSRQRGAFEAVVPIAVNIAAQDLGHKNFAREILEKMRAEHLDARSIEFEVTESGIMSEPEVAIDQLHHLHDQGYKIAIDDFGTGQSSLSYLLQLPIDTIKIDRIFIEGLTVENAPRSIVDTAIYLARSLRCDIVAEGIETALQHEALRSLQCPIGQGYFYGRPVPLERFDELLHAWTFQPLCA
jgi:predicted signal transduction protein with EAL and GGDEF domain/DNA-binding response OmpR family regulator